MREFAMTAKARVYHAFVHTRKKRTGQTCMMGGASGMGGVGGKRR